MGILKKVFIGIAVNALVMFLLTYTVDGISYTGGFKFFLLSGIILGLINFFVKPILKLLSLPIVILSGGFFLILINVFLLWFMVYFFEVAEFRDVRLIITGFQSYLIGAIFFGVINWIVHLFFKR